MLRLLLIGFALALAQPCDAALAILKIGQSIGSASTTNVMTTNTNDCPVGSLMVLGGIYLTIADTLSSVVDSAGNTWQTPTDNITGTGIGIGVAFAYNTTVDLPIGSTITATFGGTVNTYMEAVCITGALTTASPLDAHNNSSNGTSATSATTVSTGVLAQASEAIIGFIGTVGNNGTLTCNGVYTKLVTFSGAQQSLSTCTQVVSAPTSVGFSPTWTNPQNYITDLVSFKGAASLNPSLLTTGVGP